MRYIHCDLNILPDSNGSFSDKLLYCAGEEGLKFSYHSLRTLSGIYDEGYRDFTLACYRDRVRKVYPRNISHRRFSLWIDLNRDRIVMLLKDENASIVIETLEVQQEFSGKTGDLFKEKDFYLKKIRQDLSDLLSGLFSDVNIRKEEVSTIYLTGDPDILSLIYDMPTPISYSKGFFGKIPDVDSDILKIDLPFGVIPENIIDSEVETGFFLISDMLSEKYGQDFIVLYKDIVACFSQKENKLRYIFGIVEQSVQQKIVSHYQENFLNLPVKVFDNAQFLYSEAVRQHSLSEKVFSDNIVRELFDIGKLGIW